MALLEAVHRKLGSPKASDQAGWGLNDEASGAWLTLGWKAVFDGGHAQEPFVFLVGDQSALLAGCHVNSNALNLE